MSTPRRSQRPMQGPSPFSEAMRYIGVVLTAAAVLATLFTAWTPASLDPGVWFAELLANEGTTSGQDDPLEGGAPELTDVVRIGIVAGHSGPQPETGLVDPGSTCPDGLTELQVNQTIADMVVRGLEAAGYQVDLLEEFDEELVGYRAAALVSIHADACVWVNDEATGYKVAAAVDSVVPENSQRLVACLVNRYGRATDLPYRAGSITRDMTEYHTFYEIHNQTPAAIIETGFLYLDRDFLTEQPERAAQGIVDGLLCYINREPIELPGWGGS